MRLPCRKLLLTALLALVAPSLAQNGTSQPEAPQVSAPAAEPTTAEEIQARLDALKARTDLTEADKHVFTEEFVAKIENSLRQIATNQAAAAENERRTAEAPGQLDRIRADLAAPTDDSLPAPPPETPLSQLQQSLSEAQAQAAAATQTVQQVDADRDDRAKRRPELDPLIAAARERLQDANDDLATPPPADLTPVQAEVRALELMTAQRLAQTQLNALEKERANIDARVEVLPARRDLATRRQAQAQRRLDAWQQIVDAAKRRDAARTAEELRRLANERLAEDEKASRLIEDVKDLAEERAGPKGTTAELADANAKLDSLRKRLAALQHEARDAERRVEAAGLSPAVGVFLREELSELENVNVLRAERRGLLQRIADHQLRLIELEDQLGPPGESADRTARSVAEVVSRFQPRITDPNALDGIRQSANDLFTQQEKLLNDLRAEHEKLVETLSNHDLYLGQLIDITRRYRAFIEERILWVRSVQRSLVPRPHDFAGAIAWMASPPEWQAVWTFLRDRAGQAWVELGAVVLGVALLIWLRARAARELNDVASQVAKVQTDRFRLTMRALLLTLVMALPVGVGIWLIGWWLARPAGIPYHAVAIGAGLMRMGTLIWALTLGLEILRRNGLAEVHFRWPMRVVRSMRFHIRWFTPLAAASAFFTATLDAAASAPTAIMRADGQRYNDALGRVAFIIGMIGLTIVLQRALNRSSAIFEEIRSRTKGAWPDRLRVLWYGPLVLTPVVLAISAAAGYYYTAFQLEYRLVDSIGIVAVLVIVQAMLLRWLFLARRRLAIAQAKEKRRAAQARESAEPGTEPAPASEESGVNIPAIDLQTRQLIRAGIFISGLIGFYIVWSGVLPALRGLDRLHLYPRVEWVVETKGAIFSEPAAPKPEAQPATDTSAAPPNGAASTPDAAPATPTFTMPGMPTPTSVGPDTGPSVVVTLADVGASFIILILTVIATRNIPGLLEITVLKRLPLDSGTRYAISTVARYAIAIIGGAAAFSSVGISWAKVQWLAAALMFGLAFGLQEIFANFISGLIILIERPFRVGDTVTVGDVDGTVTRIRMRATTIENWDKRELILPNKTFITDRVINWTLSNPINRIRIPVGVAYGSDTDLVLSTLLRIARETPSVLGDPPYQALFLGFGDSSLNFELRVFVLGIDPIVTTRHRLHMDIDKAFRKAGIEIAFPQRDLHIRSVPPEMQLGPGKHAADNA
ncbi:MAG: mechanosensitive ion channel [Phycisphaeraceae bacterium]|nr:mechanosensitive ion channel [Phycisphaeraceae bacterium]